MTKKEDQTLTEQIQSAKLAVKDWPEWMKSVAYVSSASLTTDSAKQILQIPPLPDSTRKS